MLLESVCCSLWEHLSAAGEDRFLKEMGLLSYWIGTFTLYGETLPKSPKRAQRNKTVGDPNTDSNLNTLQ